LLRFWNHDVLGNMHGVVHVIERALAAAYPHPDPPPQAGEGA
jgi:very-short-patch-repair endonuclease